MTFITTDDLWNRYQQRQHRFVDCTVSGGSSRVLVGKDLTGIELRHVRLSEVNLTSANLDNAIFFEVTFAAVTLQSASLQRANLREADLQERNLSLTNLRGANLMHAQLKQANLQGADLRGANLTAANLRGANLAGADLRDAILGTTVLEEVITDEATQWPSDQALRRVHLSPGMSIAQLTGRSPSTSQEEEQERLPIPGRRGVLLSIVEIKEAIRKDWRSRPEQPEFRRQVLRAYGERCAISDFDVPDGLEAAHIIPHAIAGGEDKNFYTNGILLRADLHKLFDLGRLTIDPDSGLIYLDDELRRSPHYQHLHGAAIRSPAFVPAIICPHEEQWRENLRWRQQFYTDLLEGGKLFAR